MKTAKSGRGESGRGEVGVWDRWLSVLAGGTFLYAGARNKGPVRIAAVVAGSTLVLRGLTGRSMLYRTLNLTSANHNSRKVSIESSVTINRSREDLYHYWRNFENHPRFMYYIKSVTVKDEKHSHWVLKEPAMSELEWDAEVTEDRPPEFIAWNSVEGSALENSGTVHFKAATGGRGTTVRVSMEFVPPGGFVARATNPLIDLVTRQQLRADLMRFKQLMETGEIPTTDGQPSARREPEDT